MDLAKLRVFREVVRAGSFTRAAQALHLAQPSVSIHIRDLERSLGLPLFERLGRGVRPTEPGRLLADYVTRVFSLLDDAGEALAPFRGAEAGQVAVGASSTPGIYLLPPILAAFRAEHPNVRLSIRISDTGAVSSWLEELSVDVGVTGAPIAGMESEPWVHDELVLVAGCGHPWLASRPRRAAALEGAAFIMREPGSSVRAATEAWLAERSIEVDVVLTLDGSEAVKRAVSAGLGVTITSTHAIRTEVGAGELAVVAFPRLPIRRRLHLVRNPRKPLLPGAERLLADLRRAAVG